MKCKCCSKVSTPQDNSWITEAYEDYSIHKQTFSELELFEDYPYLNIPKTTNSCDGSFGQWKKKVKLHNGISKERKKQMVNQLLGGK